MKVILESFNGYSEPLDMAFELENRPTTIRVPMTPWPNGGLLSLGSSLLYTWCPEETQFEDSDKVLALVYKLTRIEAYHHEIFEKHKTDIVCEMLKAVVLDYKFATSLPTTIEP